MKSESRFVYVWLISGCIASISFRGGLISGADCIKSTGWEDVPKLSTFGDASYILLIGPPPYKSWSDKEVIGTLVFDAPPYASADFQREFYKTSKTAQIFFKSLCELTGTKITSFQK
ncbi:MAG: hypothetical protein ACP5T2_00545 [Thermoprotei archaeon]